MIKATVARTRPIVISPYLIPALTSGRIRAAVRPVGDLWPVRAGDALWVKEAITVIERQKRKDELALIYAGESDVKSVPWMKAMAKPGAGHRPADHMPIQASRFTLVVDAVETCRLAHVGEATALAAGLEIGAGGGFGALGFLFMNPFDDHTEALRFAVEQQTGCRDKNPEVVVIYFRAVARNIARLVGHAL